MEQYRRIIEERASAPNNYYCRSAAPLAIKFLETGDANALNGIDKLASYQKDWLGGLAARIPTMDELHDADFRVLALLAEIEEETTLSPLLQKWLRAELSQPNDVDLFGEILRGVERACTIRRSAILYLTLCAPLYVEASPGDVGRPTSAGRAALAWSDDDIRSAYSGLVASRLIESLASLQAKYAPDRLGVIVGAIKHPKTYSPYEFQWLIARRILAQTGAKGVDELARLYRQMPDGHPDSVAFAILLAEVEPEPWSEEALRIGRQWLQGDEPNDAKLEDNVIWLFNRFPAPITEELCDLMRRGNENDDRSDLRWSQTKLLKMSGGKFGDRAIPWLAAGLENLNRDKRLDALEALAPIAPEFDADKVAEVLGDAFQHGSPDEVLKALTIAKKFKPASLAGELWRLLDHKSKPVRDAAATALARIGPGVLEPAKERLASKKAATRMLGAEILRLLATPEAGDALEARIAIENDEKARTALIFAFRDVCKTLGRAVPRSLLDQSIAKAKATLTGPPASWMDEAALPPLVDEAGAPLGIDDVRFALHRQSKAKEMAIDPDVGAVLECVDRAKSGDFAFALLQQYLASAMDAKDRWALAIAGYLGDDRVTNALFHQIKHWVDHHRGKLAEHAVAALGLSNDDSALVLIDAVAQRYRTKQKPVGAAAGAAFTAAAERLGVSVDELGDRIVPWLGFEPGKPRVLEAGGRKIEVRVGPDLKFRVRDLDNGKTIASLPAAVGAEVRSEFKQAGATLREVAKAQLLRLENLLVRQHAWPIPRWKELYLGHPLLAAISCRLVWVVDAPAGARAFRPMEDHTLTTATDDPFELPAEGSIHLAHPLELTEDERRMWVTHFADYEIAPAIRQMERPTARPAPDRVQEKSLRDYAGVSLNALTFRGRSEKLGWRRGSVQDGGCVSGYWKSFPAANVDAFLRLEDGLYVSAGMDDVATLDAVFFVPTGSAKTGSYIYDDPCESDSRLIEFGALPAIVYSEVVGDLRTISGKASELDDN